MIISKNMLPATRVGKTSNVNSVRISEKGVTQFNTLATKTLLGGHKGNPNTVSHIYVDWDNKARIMSFSLKPFNGEKPEDGLNVKVGKTSGQLIGSYAGLFQYSNPKEKIDIGYNYAKSGSQIFSLVTDEHVVKLTLPKELAPRTIKPRAPRKAKTEKPAVEVPAEAEVVMA